MVHTWHEKLLQSIDRVCKELIAFADVFNIDGGHCILLKLRLVHGKLGFILC